MKHDTYPRYWINQLSFLLRKGLTQDFADAGHQLSAEKWAALLQLQSQGTLTPREPSDASFRDKTTVARMVDKLVAKELIERSADHTDRRVSNLSLFA